MITLYRAPFSTNVERVALALAHKGLEAESVVISYEDRSVVEEVSGQPLVPVIVDDGEVVADSIAIMRHLDERHPESHHLFPRSPSTRAQVEVFLEWFNEVWKVAPNAMEAELEKDSPDRALVAELGARMRAWLPVFDDHLDGRDFLFGDLSAADFAAFPFLRYAKRRDPADDELFHVILEEHQQLDGGLRRLSAWIDRIDALPRAYGD